MPIDNKKSTKRTDGVDGFWGRHVGPSEVEIMEMLQTLGKTSLDDFVRSVLPESIYEEHSPSLGRPLSEREALERIREISLQNKVLSSMIGLGYYGTSVPRLIQRKIMENPGWYTAYTPYQPEIAQGRLEALSIFQTMISDLTGLPVANASLLDEATAASEAMSMIFRCSKSGKRTFFVDEDIFPQTLAVLKTRAEAQNIELRIGKADDSCVDNEDVFGVLLCYPSSSGEIRDYTELTKEIKKAGNAVAFTTDILALSILKPPGEMGADVVVGSSQRFGVPLGFGGPHAAFISFRESYRRFAPGRIVGLSKDTRGRPAYRLALQTREQHIRRERATSNICTAQVLLAIMSAFYAVYHGRSGIIEIASRVHRYAVILAAGLEFMGFELTKSKFFDTIRVKTDNATEVVARARDLGINLLLLEEDSIVGISTDELTTDKHISTIWQAFGDNEGKVLLKEMSNNKLERIPKSLIRQSEFMEQSIFNHYHSEHELLRFFKRLSSKDIALDRSMIPLGSCTMKLNAAIEMEPASWAEFSDIHPFAPKDQSMGYRSLIGELEDMLAQVTGFHSICLQPNAGSQGEYSGLLTIRKYHASKGEGHRKICLIPVSAHGTNPASAIVAGLTVVGVDVDSSGMVDMNDLKRKAADYADQLSTLMLTYPSTFGLYGQKIQEICEIIHSYGGQVYMDGANLNALLGLAYPGHFGPDVSHMNLHKTFCIPHGGGGPGVGPIGVCEHLAPFLPNHPMDEDAGPNSGCGAVSAAPWGSPLVLVIPWMYLKLLGGAGLRKSTQIAILNANYLAEKAKHIFPLLYSDENERVAHECILDPRSIKDTTGITIDDIAKRLMDYGFHAPTISWPEFGTMMIEPTESETKSEIDRFCDALKKIREEIRKIEIGEYSREDNPLTNAPHVASDLLEHDWNHLYSRDSAAFPSDWVRNDKYWPPVSRIDQVWGDRNFNSSWSDGTKQ